MRQFGREIESTYPPWQTLLHCKVDYTSGILLLSNLGCVVVSMAAVTQMTWLHRASALRVLSSIRVPVIVPIMLPAIKESAADMSPFVRKVIIVF